MTRPYGLRLYIVIQTALNSIIAMAQFIPLLRSSIVVEHLQTVITGVARRAGCSGYMGLYSLLVELQADVY